MKPGHAHRSRRRQVLALLSATFVLAACSPAGAPVTSIAPQLPAATAPTRGAVQATLVAAPATETTAPIPVPMSTPAAASQIATVPPTCNNPAAATPAMTEGPFFKSGSPERASLLEPVLTGTKLVLTGYVLTADCKPVAHALLDFWQANAAGQYDNSGYTLRGHQFTDAAGYYQLETIVPGLYPGRTEHIHVKVQAPNGPLLTTQLFFPGVASNESDSIFDPKLVITIQTTGASLAATYNFVVKVN